MSEPTQPTRRAGHSAPSGHATRGRRRLFDVTTVLAVLLPLLAAGALVLVRTADTPDDTRAPTETALTTSAVVCPSASSVDPAVRVATGGDAASGRVSVGLGGQRTAASVASDRVTAVDAGDGAQVVTGRGKLAPALVAARDGVRPLTASPCLPPVFDQWFTGVGAGGRHTSVLELVNPDGGPAVADVEVYGTSGLIDVPALRGIAVPASSSVRLDLARVVPRRGNLALHVTTSRGRLGAALLDRYDELGAGASSADWMPGQLEPGRSTTLVGLPKGAGSRSLVLANGGTDQVRANIRIVTEDSTFAPKDAAEITIDPQSVETVSLTDLVRSAAADGAIGIVVDATGPVSSTLRSFVDGDLSLSVPSAPISEATAVVVPRGSKQLLLAGVDSVGVVTVVARDAGGDRLAREQLRLRPGRGVRVNLPAGAELVQVTPERSSVTGSVLVTGDGAVVVPLSPLVRTGLVPAVGPGLP